MQAQSFRNPVNSLKKIFLVLSFCVSIPLHADSLDYRWLETAPLQFYPSHEQGEWFKQQEQKRKDYESKIGLDWIQEEFEKEYSKEKILHEQTLRNGTVVQTLLNEKAAGQILKIDGTVILSSNDLFTKLGKMGLSVGNFYGFKLSPDQKWLVLRVHELGSSVKRSFAVFDLTAMKFTDVIKDAAPEFYWNSANTARYQDTNSWATYEYNFETKKIEVVRELESQKPSDQGDFIFTTEFGSEYVKVSESDSRYVSWTNLIISTFDGTQVRSLSLRDSGFYSVSYLGQTNSYFLFANDRRNVQKVLIVPYDYDRKGHLTIREKFSYEPIKAGAIQKIFTDKGFMIAEYIAGPFKTYHLFDHKGQLMRILNSPSGGSLEKFRHIQGSQFEFTFTSLVKESYSFIHDFNSEEWMPDEINSHLMRGANGEVYETKFYFTKEKDGVSIPIRVTHKKDLVINAQTPLLVAAYGGHGLITTFNPAYDFGAALFVRNGGVYANPAVRGGGEYGEKWYAAAKRTLVRYSDTETCIRELHSRKIGSPQTTAFEGWSNGGLLAGVMLTHYPELFRLVISGNGMHDMEREEALDEGNGRGWANEFGGYSSKEEVEFLRSYSPFLKAQETKAYPTAYIIAGSHDQRVHPAHSYKLVAALQDSQTGTSPILLHRFDNSGHWPTLPEYMGRPGLQGAISKWKVVFSELGMTEPMTN